MRNAQATLLRFGAIGLGRGLLEDATWTEGRKGCSPMLCTEPVPLEPDYVPFDSSSIVQGGRAQGLVRGIHSSDSGGPNDEHDAPGDAETPLRPEPPEPRRTLCLFSGEDDISSPGWMDSLLQAFTAIRSPFSFELAGSVGRVSFRFGVPASRVEVLRVAIQGLFPAVRIVSEDRPFPEGIPSSVEELVPVAPYHRTQTLLGKEGASPLGIVVASIAGLEPEDFGVFQVLLEPAQPEHDWHYNIENLIEAERRGKELALMGGLSSDFRYDGHMPPLQEPSAPEKVRRDVAFFAVVVRYAVWSSSEERSIRFRDGARSATSIVRFGNRQFRRLEHQTLKEALGQDRVRQMVVERVSHRPGLMVTSQEAATFVHLPNARTLEMFASQIEQRQGLEWTAPPAGVTKAQVIGFNDYAGRSRPVAFTIQARLKHAYLVGATGAGKSNLMKTMVLDDAGNGLGVGVVDPHGDLCMDLLARLPEHRMKDLVYVSFGEDGFVPRWNPLASNAPSGKVADDITRAFLAATSTTGPRMEHVLRTMTYVIHRLGGTLEDLAELAGKTGRGEELRVRGLAEITTPEVRRFLGDELPKYRASDLDSVRNKFSRLLLDDSLGAMFRQRTNTLEPREWMDGGRIVLVNLASGRIGADHARFTGALLVSLLHRSALSRADLSPERRRPFLLYLDEFQHLQSAAIEEILSEGRKYGLGVVLAHQEGGQLGADLLQALGNCGIRVVFRPAPEDLPRLRRSLLNRVTDSDLLRLGTGGAYAVSGECVGSLRTELCSYPALRDGRKAAEEYARTHYAPIAEAAAPPLRRRRQFDSLMEGGHS